MRLHSIEITAFGPFAGTVAVDFDELGADGLFLLHGQTGAGKTSVLDAVAFALYGTVPGSRADGRRLLSDHAPAGAAPQVCSRRRLRVGDYASSAVPSSNARRSAASAPSNSRRKQP